MTGLPEQVGRPHRERERPGEPRVRRAQLGARLAHGDDADQDGEQQEHHGVLVVQPDAGEQTGQQPEPRPVVDQGVGDHQQDRGPQHGVEGGGAQPVPDSHRQGGRRDRRRGEDLRTTASAEQPREHRGEHHQHTHREQARQPQEEQVVGGQLAREPGQQRGQRRLVGVAPGEPLPRRGEVQLVAVRPVEVHEQAQDDLERERCDRDLPDREGRSIRWAHTSHHV